MTTFGTPAPENQGAYELHFDYDIDGTHSGTLKITFDSPTEYAQEDTVVAESLIDALSASADWDFSFGFRVVNTFQRLDP